MSIRSFDQLEKIVHRLKPMRIVVVSSEDEEVLIGIKLALSKGIVIQPILVGNSRQIGKILSSLNENLKDYQIVHSQSHEESARIAIKMIKSGEAHILAKGKIKTSDFLKAILDKEQGIKASGLLSNLTLFEMSSYHKFIGITDMAIIPLPGLEEKVEIINNSYILWQALGIESPKVAVLAAVEVVNPRMQATTDAACLSKMADRDQIHNFIIDGPLSYDVALDIESARDKGVLHSKVAGDPDMLLVPNLESGNILGKSLKIHGGAKSGAIVFGARVPVMINSRSDSAERRFYSTLLARAIAENRNLCIDYSEKIES
ncbi:MAG: bifunctional enoyl-CoA hydratase/phosphate acetyltransferase [Candidatus Atribacteria bacterium]|nr:bifunctional enoyl-CoA hydratase/phosphate acetyltransferase [Candidatus Atribacteria bacterium]